MATDTRTFGTFADDGAVGSFTWNSPSNASASDDSRSSCLISSASGTSHYLKATNSSHAAGTALASGDTINSIKYRFERRKAGNPSANCRDWKIYPVEGGSIVTTTNFADTGTDWGTSDAVAEYTQTTNLPSAATILASNWGVVIAAQNTNGQMGAQPELDYIEAIITFTAATPVVVTPAAASLVTTGYAPTIRLDKFAKPASRALVLTGFAPTALLSGAAVVQPAAGAVVITTYAPLVRLDKLVKPASRALSITGLAPTIRQNKIAVPATGPLALASFAPVIRLPRTIRPSAAALALTGFAPSIPVQRKWRIEGLTLHGTRR